MAGGGLHELLPVFLELWMARVMLVPVSRKRRYRGYVHDQSDTTMVKVGPAGPSLRRNARSPVDRIVGGLHRHSSFCKGGSRPERGRAGAIRWDRALRRANLVNTTCNHEA
jgi:hypothetical protein